MDNANKKNIKLLICYHKPDRLFSDDILTPIHVGRAQARAAGNPDLAWLTENMIGDDTGENISDKNYCYNELTATYWAWKNYDKLGNPDYIGLMHYRRHFIFKKINPEVKPEKCVIEFDGMNEFYYDSINYSRENIEALLDGNDIIYYRGRVDNVYKHYCENHVKADIDLALEILKRRSPEYSSAADKYMRGSTGCFCNMAIFTRELFFEYCEWLFPILAEFMQRRDMSEKRFFISERLSGIFILKKELEGRHTLPLASSFVKSEYRIPVAIPYLKEKTLETAVTIQSLIKNSSQTTHFDIYLMNCGIDENARKAFDELLSARDDFKIIYLDVRDTLDRAGLNEISERTQFYPLILGELLPDKNKCLYIDSNALVTKDPEEFFRVASVDDFWMVADGERGRDGSFVYSGISAVVNTKKTRRHKLFDTVRAEYRSDESLTSLINRLECRDKFAIYPEWFRTVAADTSLDKRDAKSRYQAQCELSERSLVCYREGTHPIFNFSGIYSSAWWKLAMTLPCAFYGEIYTESTLALTKAKLVSDEAALKKYSASPIPPPSELSMFRKMLRFYKQYGFADTVRRLLDKLRE